MSYARFSEGDAYLFAHAGFSGWACQMCELPVGHDKRFDNTGKNCWLLTAEEVLEHLEAHVQEGHEVPERALSRIKEEIEEHGALWCYGCDE